MPDDATGDRLERRDSLVALGLFVGFALLYRLTAQERFANDGPQLATVFVQVPDAIHWQVLYLPLARLLSHLVAWGDPFEPLRVLNALGGGVGVAACYLLARGFGAERRFALAAALLVAVSRHAWFFGTSVEVHALHFGMVGLCACGTLFAPWKRPGIGLAVAALFFPLTWTTHGTAVFLGPGWVLLCAHARARVAEPFRVRTLLFVVGPVLLAALLAVVFWVKRLWSAGGGAADLEWSIILGYAEHTDRLRFLWDGSGRPLGILLAAVVIGLVVRSRGVLAIAALIFPGTAFLLWWGVPEEGGYFLGHAPFHAVLAAAAFKHVAPKSMILVPGALFLQLASSWAGLHHFDSRFDPADRVALVREHLGETGLVGKLAYQAPDVGIWLPGVDEVDLTGRLLESYRADIAPDELAELVAPTIENALAAGPVALDVSYTGESWSLAGEEFPAYVDDFVAALLARFEVERVTRGTWTLAVLQLQ